MARFLAATAAMTTSSCRPPSGGAPGPWSCCTVAGAAPGPLFLALGPCAVPAFTFQSWVQTPSPGAGVPGSGRSCVLEAAAECQAWLPCQAGAGFVFPANVWLLARVSPGAELGLSFWLPSAPPPPSCPCHGCHLLSPCRVPGTLPTCSRCVLVTALGAGDPLPPSPVHTLESTCPAAMLPWAALCPGHCYCHFRVTAQEWWAKQGGDLQERGQDPGKRSHCSQEVLEQWGPEGVQAALGGGVAVMLPGGSPTTSFPGSEPHAAL